jgi:hypothetical protein
LEVGGGWELTGVAIHGGALWPMGSAGEGIGPTIVGAVGGVGEHRGVKAELIPAVASPVGDWRRSRTQQRFQKLSPTQLLDSRMRAPVRSRRKGALGQPLRWLEAQWHGPGRWQLASRGRTEQSGVTGGRSMAKTNLAFSTKLVEDKGR